MVDLAVCGRRRVSFETLSQILPEVERLRNVHHTVGHWSFAQICKHLADSVHGSIDGFDLRRHRIKRFLFAKVMLRYAFRYGIPPGYTVDPHLTPPELIDIGVAIEELRQALERYQRHRGPLAAHPLFGKMPRDLWDRIHRIHCAHHLGFVIPTDPPN